MNWKRGLDYGWWRNSDLWSLLILGVGLGCLFAALLGAWFL